jgi:hypothetical protein
MPRDSLLENSSYSVVSVTNNIYIIWALTRVLLSSAYQLLKNTILLYKLGLAGVFVGECPVCE